MPDATHDTLREQVTEAIRQQTTEHTWYLRTEKAADSVMLLFAERERLLRERIEALPSPGTYEKDRRFVSRDAVLAVFDA